MVFARMLLFTLASAAPAPTASDVQLVLDWDGRTCPVVSLQKLSDLCQSLLAKEVLDKSLRAELYLRQADALYFLDDDSGSAKAAEQAQALHLTPAKAQWRLARVLLRNPNRRREALTIAENLINQQPDIAEAYVLAGSYFLETNDFAKAVAHFSSAIEKDKGFASAYVLRGYARHQQGECQLCLEDLQAARLLPPMVAENGKLSALYGTTLLRLKRFHEGAAFLLDAQKHEPLSPQLSSLLWICLVESEKHGAALAVTEQSVKSHPDDELGHWTRARSLAQFGMLEEAEREASVALRLAPNSQAGWIAIGIVRERKGDLTQAVSAYFKAMKLGQLNLDNVLRAAFIFATSPEAKWRDGQMAQEMADKCLAGLNLPKYRSWATVVLALAQAESGDTKKALDTISQAAKLAETDSGLQTSCRKLADLFREGKAYRHDPARPDEQIFSLDPGRVISNYR